MSITFKVDDVKAPSSSVVRSVHSVDSDYIRKWRAEQVADWTAGLGIKPELEGLGLNTSVQIDLVEPNTNWFVKTAMSAFREHRAIAFSPEEIWLVILQAMTRHIIADPKACKSALGITWDGQKELLVVNSDFIKGQVNPWEREFGKFGDQIEQHLGKQRKLFDATFSATNPVEQAAISVQMMAALAPYFKYSMMTLCGVPTVTLLGEASDWADILVRVISIGEWYPTWALAPLQTAVGHFVQAAAGRADVSFWQHFFKTPGGSGGTPVNGWINAFFPYIKGKPNKLMVDSAKSFADHVRTNTYDGNQVGSYGSSIASVPMDWDYRGTHYSMKLITGIMGKTLTDDTYRSVIGYAVGESTGAATAEEYDSTY